MSIDEIIAENGEAMDKQICMSHADLIADYDRIGYFNLAVLASLTWSGHAIFKRSFFRIGNRLLETGDVSQIGKLEKYAGRFGIESLSRALSSWKQILYNTRMGNMRTGPASYLINCQQNMLAVANRMRQRNELHGIGPWLFCGPFKIILAHRKSLWKDPEVDRLLLPLGLEVVRAAKHLKRQHHLVFRDLESSIIEEEEGDLIEGMGTLVIIQDLCRRMATLQRTRIIHINSGLYLLGAGKLNAS